MFVTGPKYNRALRNRGSITFWFTEESIKNWHETARETKRGRPKKYSDLAITCGLTLKAVFNLTFRSIQGFMESLTSILKLNIKVPDYTLLCKRQKNLLITLPKCSLKLGEKLNIVVDTTGLKVFGEGEWKVRQHGYVKHRLWRKLHLAVNSETQEIEAFELTELGIQDCQGLPKLINKIDAPIESVTGDGAFDRFSCYELGEEKDFKMIAPPQRNAKPSRERTRNRKRGSSAAVKKRDANIDRVREIGRREWKIEVGYHQRSLSETAMFRLKTLLGNKMRAKTLAHQKTEAAIWCSVLNKMTSLGFGK